MEDNKDSVEAGCSSADCTLVAVAMSVLAEGWKQKESQMFQIQPAQRNRKDSTLASVEAVGADNWMSRYYFRVQAAVEDWGSVMCRV